VRLTTSPCKKKFVENLLRKKKILEEAKAHLQGCGATDDDDDDDDYCCLNIWLVVLYLNL
jgi:hypothetical protein